MKRFRNSLKFIITFCFGVFFTGTILAQEFDPNATYRLTAQFTGPEKSLDVINDATKDKVQLSKSGNYQGQIWKITPLKDGYYRLTNTFTGTEKSLDVINDASKNKLQLAKSGEFTGQYWKITPIKDGYYRITSKFTGTEKSLDVINDASKSKLQLGNSGEFTGQYWKITNLSPAKTTTPATSSTFTAYMPKPANNSFSGDVINVKFTKNGVSDVSDSKGNRSLNQQIDGTVILHIQDGGKTVQTIRVAGPKANLNQLPAANAPNPSSKKSVAYMPKPANNTFSGDVVTVSFDERGVSTVKDSKGNGSLNQQVNGQVTLEIQLDGKKIQTIIVSQPN